MPQYNLKTPCRECPFRKDSAPGWLGSYTPQEVMEVVVNDGPFLCHSRVDYDDDDWDDEDALAVHEECAGSMIFARRLCKLSRDREKSRGQMQVDKDFPILFPAAEFIQHHERKKS